MTPEHLREEADNEERDNISDVAMVGKAEFIALLRAHATALEEIERLREAVELLYDRWENGEDCHEVSGDEMGAFLGKAFRLSEAEEGAVLALLKGIPTPSLMQTVTQRAEKAEAERDALKRHAEEVKRDLAASVVKSAELEEENSKLRSALAIVHFKREPWQ